MPSYVLTVGDPRERGGLIYDFEFEAPDDWAASKLVQRVVLLECKQAPRRVPLWDTADVPNIEPRRA